MIRINLYNYRYQQVHYKKLRLYFLITSAVILALLINIFIYVFYQVKIMYQETRNSFLNAHISMLNERLKPIKDFEARIDIINKHIELINSIENERDDMVAFFQKLNQITPQQIYFTNISWNESSVTFNGVSSSPVYLADFLDRLRAESGIFYDPVLKSNNAATGGNFNFLISSMIKENLVAESNAHEENQQD
ncbi:PilN domain-containing protein [Aquella oligotrophica]|uniref:Fimbrial assembly protein (PilN) n=1 Tax=Aquella oligotrophica TaxID=2067065 RepID=A0A2I7N338_9NEIS|nr:PilN domain-containing protein [Aquella oligotrophica]AUR50877.1 hypothetical protein CUN60_00690 [Aquella oligotrophica]